MRGALLAALFGATGLLAQTAPPRAPAETQIVELGWTPSGWKGTVVRAQGTPTWSEPELWPAELPPGSLFFVVFAAEKGSTTRNLQSPVIARGRLSDPALTTLDPEEDGMVDPLRLLEVDVPRASTQIRVPAEPAATVLEVFKVNASGGADRVAGIQLSGGRAPGGGPPPEPIGSGGLEPNRVGVLLTFEGFERDRFDNGEIVEQATGDMVQVVRQSKPFDTFGHLLAFSRVRTISSDDGVNREGSPFPVDTYFGLDLIHARKNGQPITNGPSPNAYEFRMPDLPDAGWAKLLDAGATERRDVIALLINHGARPGGLALWDGGPLGVSMTTLDRPAERLIHHIGHLIGGLGDETASTPPVCQAAASSRPNAGRNAGSVPWKDLVDLGLVGPPQPGALGCDQSWVHPQPECVMHGGAPPVQDFCEVCREAIVDGLYARVKLVDGREPVETAPVFDQPAPPTFTVRTNARAGQTIVAQWSLDRLTVADPGGTGASFSFTPPAAAWTPGRHVVRVSLEDQSRLGANAREAPMLLRSMPHEVRWDVTVKSAAGPAPLAPAGVALKSP